MFTVDRMNQFFRTQSFMDKEGLGVLPANVLLAHGDPTLRNSIATFLREDGYDVVETENGGELMTNLAFPLMGEQWDVVISDVSVPALTGLEALKALRNSNAVTPFIAITSLGDQPAHDEAYRLGATAVFDRPLHLEELRKEVKRLITP